MDKAKVKELTRKIAENTKAYKQASSPEEKAIRKQLEKQLKAELDKALGF